MKNIKTFYITTPIYYVNDRPHIGHAYTNIVSDIIARFKRLDGFYVKFLTGTDEHGQKVERSALKKSLKNNVYVDKIAQNFIKLAHDLNISNNDFIRTTQGRHKEFVQFIWNKLIKNHNIYLDKYSGWYSIKEESYIFESNLTSSESLLKNEYNWIEEPSYFFKLSAFQDKLLKFYAAHPEFIKPINRRNEVISFVKSGLKDLSISRTSCGWGIKVPDDSSHTIYVWLDALFSYVSALNKKDLSFWPADLHIIGKDILRFHAVYWPAFLMAANLPIPKTIFAHGWWTNNNKKISKSLGNTINPYQLIKKYNVDYVRYYLIREMVFGNDAIFSEDSLVQIINSELVNKIGNLIFRTTTLIYVNCEKKIPSQGILLNSDQQLLYNAYNSISKIRDMVNDQNLNQGIGQIIVLANYANSYIDEQAPWILRKNNLQRMNTVLYVLSEVIRIIGILLQPIIPNTAKYILDYFKIKNRSFCHISESYSIKSGISLSKPIIVFQKLDTR